MEKEYVLIGIDNDGKKFILAEMMFIPGSSELSKAIENYKKVKKLACLAGYTFIINKDIILDINNFTGYLPPVNNKKR